MGKYFLIGIPDCGKSTLGKLAADILKFPFYDTDIMASKQVEFKGFANIFSSDFSKKIMDAQLSVIIETAKLEGNAIISTGAEVSLVPECVRYMRDSGTIIHIKRNPELILERLKNRKGRKIVLRDVNTGMEIDMQQDAVKLYMEEYSKYEAIADLYLENNKTEDKGARKLVMLINKCQLKNNES